MISCSSGHFKDNARIRFEQNNDIVLRNLKEKLEGNPFDENELASDYRYQHYLQNITRIEITKMIQEARQKFYYPCMAEYIKKWVTNCQVCIQTKRINNDAQTIGLLERIHASVKSHLKAATGEFRNNWQKYLPLAVLNYNTTYHASLGCEPSRVFHGRIPHNILDYKLGYNSNPISPISLHQPQQTPGKFLPLSFKTTTQKQTTYSHVRCKLHRSRICYND